MKTKPYIPYSIRTKETWGKVGEKLGVDPVIARDAAIEWGGGFGASQDFARLVLAGEIKKEEISFENNSLEELEEKQKSWDSALEERDFCDLLSYRLKSLVEVGDEWVCNESAKYLSGGEYFTRGERYTIVSLDDRDEFSGFNFSVHGNVGEEYPIHQSSLAVKSLWRDDLNAAMNISSNLPGLAGTTVRERWNLKGFFWNLDGCTRANHESAVKHDIVREARKPKEYILRSSRNKLQ